MRASTLTFIFIISEYSIITGGDGNCGNPPDIDNTEKAKNTPNTNFRMMCKPGYMRKAGTSNLFKCKINTWVNNPPLECIQPPYKSSQNPTPHSTFTPSWSSHGTQAMNSTPTVSGKTVSTTIHTASTTSWTSHRTTQRTTTTTEETSVTTSITARIAASSTTEKDSLSVSMSSHSPSSRSTTSTVVPDQQTGETTKGITAGIGIIITVVVFAAVVGFLLWRRRSTPPETSDQFVTIARHNPGSVTPLMRIQTINSCSPDFTEPPASPLIDSAEIKYTNISLSA
ncbi:interleukin-15 receptor subunit alpha isoform X2 [Silurus meridionalis]|uniref:interleukin-15 receptor subunit alpha isoform X2 n=1 Tax=Silurus meridionalis TaxID=175797 RepID=UPI001EEBE34A|nr:interleukin-15 receptor subunit alpha isoform X2 [Silurus meridionalis]